VHVDNSVAHTHAPDETGELRPVFFASRSLTPGERNCSATALEALCCVWAAELFRPYVGNTHFKMKTDHRVLVRLFGASRYQTLCSTTLDIAFKQFSSDFECIYTPGKGNVVCDALSRYPQLTTKYDLKNETLIESLCVIAEGDSHRICRDCENKYPLAQHKPIANGKAWEVHCAGKRHITATDMAVTDVMLITSTKLTAEEPLVLVQGPAKQLKCETCTTLREKCKYKKCTVLVPIGNGKMH
jgi:hypothetical protein